VTAKPATTVAPPSATTPAPVATTARAPATTAAAPSPVTSFPQDFSTGKPPFTVPLAYPIPGAPVVSTFGMRVDPVLGTRLMHEGIDIWAGEGTPIHAAGAGTVIWAGDRHGYGNAVFIDHGRGLVTIYAHQSKVGVTVGQHVNAGDTIGFVGHTGLAAGPHLHFEVRIGGVAYDPLNFVTPR
jgi:murein DD-endopeptidase MepM/ murein hydrolase activator NlpD